MDSSIFKDLKVLVIHALRPTSRQTTIDHLTSFSKHMSGADVQYLHFQQPIPKECASASPDLVIVNYDFLNYRFTPLWPFIKNRHKDIAQRANKLVAIVQDDFWGSKLIDDWCIDWDVDRILTPIDNDLEVLYPRSIKRKEFRTCLTGYISEFETIETTRLRERPIDLGQRVRDMSPHLGRLAQAKSVQAQVMADAARRAGFTVDVSTRVEDSFIGKSWLEFLKSCKFTVGMKGGASLHDPIGFLHTKVNSYLVRHPNAKFDEIERKFFRGKDMKYKFSAISPRLFESAAAGTCQILQRDDYLGVLQPWRDYLPLEVDFSNIDEVVSSMRDLEKCQEIANNATRNLIESGLFNYSKLAEIATSGLFMSSRTSQHGWGELKSYLKQIGAVAESGRIELHDAAFEVIKEHLIFSNRDTATFKSELKLGSVGSGSKVAIQTVLESLDSESDKNWFEEVLATVRSDSKSKLFPWVWRPLF